MGSIEDEIKKVQEAAAKKVAELKAKAAKEEARVREVMLDILAEQDSAAFDRLHRTAVSKIDAEKKQRSAAAKAAKVAGEKQESSSTDSAPAASAQQQGLQRSA